MLPGVILVDRLPSSSWRQSLSFKRTSLITLQCRTISMPAIPAVSLRSHLAPTPIWVSTTFLPLLAPFIDLESMRISLAGTGGALILFDFEAAFPSISQEFLISMLTRLHLPSEVTNVV